MSEEHSVSVAAPVTVTVDIDQIIRASGYVRLNDGEDGYYEQAGLGEMVAHLIANKLAPDMRKAVTDAVRTAALAQVDAIVSEVVQGTLNLTNEFGEPTGKATTLREQIVASARDRLDRKVNSRGEVDRYARDGMTYARWIAKDAAEKAIRGELQEAAKEAVAEVKASVHAIVADDLASKITRTVTRAL